MIEYTNHRACFVLQDPDGTVVQVEKTHNWITAAGLQHYAERVHQSTGFTNFSTPFIYVAPAFDAGTVVPPAANPGDTFDVIDTEQIGSAAIDTGYPQNMDPDPLNPDAALDLSAVVTWRATFGPNVANGNIVVAVMANSGATATSPILNAVTLNNPINKVAGQTVSVFINHAFVDLAPVP